MPDLFDILHREWPVIKNAPFSFFIAVIAVVALLELARKFIHRKKVTPLPQTSNSEAVVKDSGNASITQNFSWPPQPAPLPEPETPPIKESPKHNLTTLGMRLAMLTESITEKGAPIFVEREDSGDIEAMLVCMTNSPSAEKRVAAIDRVAAQIVFKDSNGTEVARVDRGRWVSYNVDLMKFGVGETRCLIAALIDGKEPVCPGWRRQSTHWGDQLFPEFRTVSESARVAEVTVLLLGSGESLPTIPVEIKTKGAPQSD